MNHVEKRMKRASRPRHCHKMWWKKLGWKISTGVAIAVWLVLSLWSIHQNSHSFAFVVLGKDKVMEIGDPEASFNQGTITPLSLCILQTKHK